jgi:hypothetical protein
MTSLPSEQYVLIGNSLNCMPLSSIIACFAVPNVGKPTCERDAESRKR